MYRKLYSRVYTRSATDIRARGRLIVDLVSRQRGPDKSHFTPPSNKGSAVASLAALQIFILSARGWPAARGPAIARLHLIPLLEATSRWAVENFCPPEQKTHSFSMAQSP